jgi:hypothetical protein
MEQNKPAAYNERILELVQKWRTETIEGYEYRELSAWFYALEEKELGPPIEITVELVEKRIHEQLHVNKMHKTKNTADAPPHPWHDKKTDTKI